MDFNYEVSRSLAACEGAILVVDASQGVEAQTLANVYLALENDLEIIPVLNKVDLPNARVEEVKKEIEEIIGIDAKDAPCISAKTGLNIHDVLERIILDIPAPKGEKDEKLKALIFDSEYDNYKGVISSVRVMDGTVKKNDEIYFMFTDKVFTVTEVGYFGAGSKIECEKLSAGEVGYIAASVKNAKDVQVGDTITHNEKRADKPLPGYKEAKSMVYCGMFPMDGKEYIPLKDALEKLKLNDAAFNFEPETSKALGFGFRCGFLGLLHLEIIVERIEREYGIGIITTAPSVIYNVYKRDGQMLRIYNPTDLPDLATIDHIDEPIMNVEIFVPKEYIGNVMEVCQLRRGVYLDMKYIDDKRVNIFYEMPLNEIIYDFFDYIKSKTKGYASVDYTLKEYKKGDLVKLDMRINNENMDALSFIVHKDSAYNRGRKMAEKLKKEIPRQQIEIPIQAVIGGNVIARETVKAYRKDVIAKCYGGDITRKRKLLEKQKQGKKKMKQIGSIEVPQEAFLSVLKFDSENE